MSLADTQGVQSHFEIALPPRQRGVLHPLSILLAVAIWLVPDIGQAQDTSVRASERAAIIHDSPTGNELRPQIWQAKMIGNRLFATHEKGISVRMGAHWTMIETPGKTTVRSIDSDKHGRIYYGEQGGVGYVKIDSSGAYKAYAIDLPDSVEAKLENVWATHVRNDRVEFQSRAAIVSWRVDGTFDLIESKSGFHNSFRVNDRVFVREFGTGLFELVDGRLNPLVGGDVLADEFVYGITHSSHDLLVWTQTGAQYVIKGDSLRFLRNVSSRLADIAKDYRLYSIAQGGQNEWMIGTLGAGIVVTNERGDVLQRADAKTGFPDDFVNSVVATESGSYLLALNNEGVASYRPQISKMRYRRQHGLWGHINRIGALNGHIAVATGSRLAVSVSEDAGPLIYSSNPNRSYFEEVDGTELSWDFTDLGGVTFVATETGGGVFQEGDESIRPCALATPGGAQMSGLSVQIFSVYPDVEQGITLAGTNNGLYQIVTSTSVDGLVSCSLMPLPIPELDRVEIKEIAQSGDGYWISSDNAGLFNLSGSLTGLSVRHYDLDRYPDISSAYLLLTEGARVFFADQHAVYVNDSTTDFIPRKVAVSETRDGRIEAIHASGNDLWIAYSDSISVLREVSAGTYSLYTPDALKYQKGSTSDIYVHEDGIVWYSDGDELVAFDPRYTLSAPVSSSTFITSVITRDYGVSLFGGTFPNDQGGIGEYQPAWAIPRLPFWDKALVIWLSADGGLDASDVLYQYSLTGGNGSWSPLSTDNEISISTLSEGKYQFQARAVNDLGLQTETISFSFIILPPWYRTAWAYLGYVLFGGALIFAVVKYAGMRKAHKKALEHQKELERERVVVKKLQQANDSLTKANKLKDEFLASTSHELRTPLTAILGFTSVLKEEVPPDAEYREFLDIIADSGGRLMDTLNSLLDLAKLRAGTQEISLEQADIYRNTMDVAVTFQELAKRKGLQFKVDEPVQPLMAMIDVHAFHRIMHNLLSNAVKFTDEGEVHVRIAREDDQVRIDVMDTGIGIDDKFLPELFGEYMQESDGLARTYEGSGLGLAISSKMTDLMGAKLSVESVKGAGSTFSLFVPAALGQQESRSRIRGFGQSSTA